jgi:transcriptional regulator with XRE-family HTH domain
MAELSPSGELSLANRLQVRLAELGISQTDLARRSDVSLSYISRLVRGQIRNPTLDVMRKLADGLDLKLEELAGSAPLPEPLTTDGAWAPRVVAASGSPGSLEAPLGEPVPILGRPVNDPRAMFGHEGLIRSMRRLWMGRTMQHTLIDGPPQSGKSSLLLALKNAAQLSSHEWLEAWQALGLAGAERERVAAERATLWSDPDQPIQFVYASFNDPQLTLSEPLELVSAILDQVGASSSDLPGDDGADNSHLLVEFVRRVRSLGGKRTAWLLDDVDRMVVRPRPTDRAAQDRGVVGRRFAEFAPLFLRACRTLGADDRVSLAFVMTYTSELEATIDLQQDASSPFFGLVCHKFTLGPLETAAARNLTRALLRRAAAHDPAAVADVVECIVQLSAGWPYLIQRLCQSYLTASTTDAGTFVSKPEWHAQGVLDRDSYAHRLLANP